jgi:hypothetical protein
MKACAYCGRETEPAVTHCFGCGTALVVEGFVGAEVSGTANEAATERWWIWLLLASAFAYSFVACVGFVLASMSMWGSPDSGPLSGQNMNRTLTALILLLPNIVSCIVALKAMRRAQRASRAVAPLIAGLAVLISVLLGVVAIAVAIDALLS